MNYRTKLLCSLLLNLTTHISPIFAQDQSESIVIGQRYEMESAVLGEKINLLISTPVGYENDAQAYGVLYVLDGESHFRHITASVGFLSHPVTSKMPPLIVVGVVNRDRRHDFTPQTNNEEEKAQYPTHGGADKFLRFLSEDLSPWINERYRTNGYQALAGHSLSGLFAFHTLVTSPEEFSAYLAISPSIWWDNGSMAQQVQGLLDTTPNLKGALYMASGDEPLYENAVQVSEVLEESAPDDFRWTLDRKGDQTHNSVAPLAFYEGLEMIFDGWDISEQAFSMFEESSIDELEAFYQASGDRFGMPRSMPSITLHYYQDHLITNGRLDAAAEMMMYKPETHYLVPVLLDWLIGAYIENNDEDKAVAFLEQLAIARPSDQVVASRLVKYRSKGE